MGEALKMRIPKENLPVVGADAFKDCTTHMKRMGKNRKPRLSPRHQRTIEPDQSVTIIKGKHGSVALGCLKLFVRNIFLRSCRLRRVSNLQSKVRFALLRASQAYGSQNIASGVAKFGG
ncbi:MAG: hypothetical protein MnENMB40S_16760 [Rhizobiaceae bacterium MnEN-MB40S]|nr:MAG: hypothetical protein MnENMB40S_16760 [Rhizobiaceae bacterium MnEN-MB40S]